MTLNCYKFKFLWNFALVRIFCEATTTKRMKIDRYYKRQKCKPMTPSFRKYKAHADIRGGSPGWGHQMTVGLSTTAIFGDLGGYFFFGNVTDKTSNNTHTCSTRVWTWTLVRTRVHFCRTWTWTWAERTRTWKFFSASPLSSPLGTCNLTTNSRNNVRRPRNTN